MTNRQLYSEAVRKFGYKNQFIKAAEELCELSQVILKIAGRMNQYPENRSDYEDLMEKFYEEYADVQITLDQVELMLGDPIKFCFGVEKWKKFKLERLENLCIKK